MTTPGWTIERLGASPTQRNAEIDELATLLVDTVAGGGSVGFMHPLPHDIARNFWAAALEESDRGHRVILGATTPDRMDDGTQQRQTLIGTVSISVSAPQNQPHRAEIMKMMTARAFARQGAATTLLIAAEQIARDHEKTLLTLDTAEDGGAGRLYERLGYVRAGLIPGYAYKPHGGMTGTVLYWKRLDHTPAEQVA
ncbi:histone acetyltransferase HPA2 [Acetobacter nitrogenifigens DSM 23921 = NBRC 105050]|uniref:N-acetyltransferase n=1 Tax=Acetobacter nitrogenifigens DSM 23921 = NBRC 105050 TaxID=1120919 RepID=A0A511XB84_9PROT|nr:GNAT family N-acetyltransferase [Acetobacter nitrogenifigens]GBQ90810.1 histone acetyltransferase HPA2 [Acetobacter nitrogenifigens DSM 23921 = NBRC 105050]GEN60243.1 N-acetyltransferase [Acetobacter nitrogenifigens DSM 23921 = NBRC 105050]